MIETKTVIINPVDVKIRQNKTALAEELAELKPIILGWDVSVIVVEKGAKAGEFEIGQEVFGMINFAGHGKAYAKYVAARSDQIALKPENITHEQATASCMAALTAWQAFNYFMKLGKNEKILVHGAAGGAGHFAVQIAKYKKSFVVGTSSEQNKDFVLSLGADEHIDYKIDAKKQGSSRMQEYPGMLFHVCLLQRQRHEYHRRFVSKGNHKPSYIEYF